MPVSLCTICELCHEPGPEYIQTAETDLQRLIVAINKANFCASYMFECKYKINLAPDRILATVEGKDYDIADSLMLQSLKSANQSVEQIAKKIVKSVRNATQPCGCTPPEILIKCSSLEQEYLDAQQKEFPDML